MKKLLFAGLVAGFFLACHKDFDNTVITTGPIPTINVQASLYGRVLDAAGTALSGAQVQVNDQILITNEQGLYFAYNQQLNKNGTYVRVQAAGYFPAGRFAYPQLGSSTYLEIVMSAKQPVSFSTASVANVSVSGGASVSIPAQSLVTAGGQSYSGNYLVAARWLDPSDPATFTEMPGDLRAQDADGLGKVLKTFGMIGVELSSPAGDPLQLAPGQKATIRLPLPAAVQAVAPASIPLWHFDEATGYWRQEGSATREGNQYVGEVSHFSFWNCDVPADYILLNGCLVDGAGQPLVNMLVSLTSAQFGTGFGHTDAQGLFGGLVPANEVLNMTLKVADTCNTVIYATMIGPFTTNTTLAKIEVNLAGQHKLTLSGELVDCSGLPLTTGLAYVYDQTTLVAVLPADANGHFQGTIYTCNPLSTLGITAYDAANPLQSAPAVVNVVSNMADAGAIPVCSTSTLDQYVTIQLNGIQKTFFQLTGFSSDTDGSLFAENIDSNYVQLLFNNYSASTSQATIIYMSGLYFTGSSTHYFGCDYCPGCPCELSDTGPLIFTNYPQNVGEYATGTASGSVWDFDSGALVPYSLSFRLKKIQ